MEVWVLIAEAIYDHGCFGVFADQESAERHAEFLWDQSDGHHTFRIERHTVDAGRAPGSRLTGFNADPRRSELRRGRERRGAKPHYVDG